MTCVGPGQTIREFNRKEGGLPMRWTGFLLGGLAGAAAAVYMAKRRPGMFAWASTAAGEVWEGWTSRAANAMVNRKFGNETMQAKPKNINGVVNNTGEAWTQIQTLVNSDPNVKQEAEKIVAEAQSH
jgi:hypothetical protein